VKIAEHRPVGAVTEPTRLWLEQTSVASPQEMLKAASVKVAARGQSMREMIQEADTNLLTVIKEIRAGAWAADEQDDPGTVDLFSRFVQIHEKHEWWLRDILEKRDRLLD
jgi:starvation-inducible DNA-binding protein